MQWLASICVKRPVFATVLILTIAVVGVIGYFKLNVDRFPNVDFPIVTVVTVLPGAAPQQIETEVTDKIEEAVNTISGLEELQSISTEGVSQLIVRFNLDKDVNVAAQEVRDQVSTALPNLPEGTKNPVITKLDPDAAPVLFVALLSKRPIRDVTEFAEHEVRGALENVQGVGQVSILGGRKRQIQVVLDPSKLRAAGLSAVDVQRAIVAQNVTTPGGAVDTGPERLTFRVSGRVPTVTAVGEIIVRAVEGHPIAVRDVGTVVDGQEEAETAASIDGQPAVVMSIRKQSGANSVAVVDALNERIKEFSPRMPPGYKLSVIRDNTETTRTSVGAVKEHLGLGAVLASLVVLLFLGSLRSTFIAAIAIPTSIIGTFMCMWWMDFTLNTITLLALALAVGIVIDDAIVVLENIFRYIEEKRVRPMPAAIYATKEIGLPVLATTLSLLAVFLPVAFMSSIPGRFLRSFGLTMGAAIVISLLVSFTLTPMLSSRLLRLPPRRRAAQDHSRAVHRRVLPADRARLHGDAPVLASPPLAGGAGGARHAGLHRPADQGGPQGLPAQERRGAVPDRCADTGGDQPGRDADRRRADRARGPAMARGANDGAVDRRQPAEDAEPRVDLRSPGSARRAHRLPGRAAEPGAQARSCPSCPRSIAPASRWWPRSGRGRSARPPSSSS